MQPRHVARYGWVRDLPDHRDLLLAPFDTSRLPVSVDLRHACPPVYDQGQLGSCTGNAIAAAVEFEQNKQKVHTFRPSRLWIYYQERVIEGTVDQDSGAQIRDGMKVVAKLGAPPETDWPYDIAQFAVKPPVASYTDALKDRVLKYLSVQQSVDQMKACLAAGYPFVFGFTVYDSFESQQVAQTGVMPMPAPNENVIGGHAVMAVGYENNTFIIRNSWGTGWGQAGYFTMPNDYIADSNLASDFWTVRLVEA